MQAFYQLITHEEIDMVCLQKLKLIKQSNDSLKPTGAYFLFADEDIKSQFFPYAKVECARFKGTTLEETLDQKTFQGSIIQQTELAYDFILRHINKGSTIEGVYTKSKWEYPIIAIREVIRNAIVHRDYSLTGKDIKVAIYDDMVEITSPGKLMPSIDYDDRESGQSDVRNKVIAPIFKKLGIIDQWGNGLKLIDEELKLYKNEIEFLWRDTGTQFQVQFVKKQIKERVKETDTRSVVVKSSNDELIQLIGTKLALSWHQVGTKLAPSWKSLVDILETCIDGATIVTIMGKLNLKDRTKFRNKYIKALLELGIVTMSQPDKPNSPNQLYYTTEKGKLFLENIKYLL
ncbi:hypothetical protein LLG10_06315 [bacterium]|nr:hypothetical protein [bacterium]